MAGLLRRADPAVRTPAKCLAALMATSLGDTHSRVRAAGTGHGMQVNG